MTILSKKVERRLLEEARVEVLDTESGKIDRDKQNTLLAAKLEAEIMRNEAETVVEIVGEYARIRSSSLVRHQRRSHKLNRLHGDGKFALLDPYAVITVGRRIDCAWFRATAADVLAWMQIESGNAARVLAKHAKVTDLGARLLPVLGGGRVEDVLDVIRVDLADLIYEGTIEEDELNDLDDDE